MTIKTLNPGIYQTLIAQLDKVARHNRQGSFRTKERYYEAMHRFCKFLSEEYRLHKLANFSGKHLTAYVIHDTPRSTPQLCRPDLSGVDRWRPESTQCQPACLPAFGPRAGRCHPGLFGLHPKGQCRWEIVG